MKTNKKYILMLLCFCFYFNISKAQDSIPVFKTKFSEISRPYLDDVLFQISEPFKTSINIVDYGILERKGSNWTYSLFLISDSATAISLSLHKFNLKADDKINIYSNSNKLIQSISTRDVESILYHLNTKGFL